MTGSSLLPSSRRGQCSSMASVPPVARPLLGARGGRARRSAALAAERERARARRRPRRPRPPSAAGRQLDAARAAPRTLKIVRRLRRAVAAWLPARGHAGGSPRSDRARARARRAIRGPPASSRVPPRQRSTCTALRASVASRGGGGAAEQGTIHDEHTWADADSLSAARLDRRRARRGGGAAPPARSAVHRR